MALKPNLDPFGAFLNNLRLLPPPSSSPDQPPPLLRGLTFAVKDIFDITGCTTGFGNPDWARTHTAPTFTAPSVLAVLEAGATCVGKTVMDEMAYSINGENYHYGTPTNPCAPDRVPGGSSSGSAVAVAANLVDFSLGTDTGGSVRVPASYCGIFGFRPSHGIISTVGVTPMAQIFDTVGWFARDPITLTRVGQVLLPSSSNTTGLPTQFVVPGDCFEYLGSPSDKVSQILKNSVKKIFGSSLLNDVNLGDYIYHNVPSLLKFISGLYANQESTVPVLAALSHAMRLLQRFEFKTNHEAWLNSTKPTLGPGILERVSEALNATYEDLEICHPIRSELQVSLSNLLQDNGVLALPTIPGAPPKLNMEVDKLGNFRSKAFSLLSIAGMSGYCQISIPLGMHDGLPVSVSLLAKHNSDLFLLNLAQTLYGALKEQASIAWEDAN
ncbi:amidase 1-like isoform X1 [Zingiber officinale]|uniref:amidase 1-like isoform X1 n=1 Tax=Zingiber officinale TaxID=94328 RepID=UPI001C4BC5E6|nr:amidase 1-like isoform X1 [Zingiber officinale]